MKANIEIQGRAESNATDNNVLELEMPCLSLNDLQIAPLGFSNLVVWGNLESSRFLTLPAAQAAIRCERHIKCASRAHGARLFAWNGQSWKEIF